MKISYNRVLKTMFSLLAAFAFFSASAQKVLLRGTVKDANGQTLPGASITVQGTTSGVVADNNGNYSLSVAPGKYTLVVSFVGYATRTVDVNVPASGATEDVILQGGSDLGVVTV